LTNRFSISIAGNYNQRQRTLQDYYDFPKKKYVNSVDSLSSNPLINALGSSLNSIYANPALSTRKYGGNINLSYKVKGAEISARGGASYGREYKNIYTGTTNLAQSSIYSYYGQLTLQSKRINTYIDFQNGIDNYVLNANSFKFNYSILNAYFHYEFKFSEKLSVIPAISSQYTNNDGNKYIYIDKQGQTFMSVNNSSIYNYAPSLRINYFPIKNLRLLGSIRVDKYTKNDKLLPNYAIIANYSINENNIVRLSFSNAYMGQFSIRTNGSTISAVQPLSVTNNLYLSGVSTNSLANTDYQTVELGYRSLLSNIFSVDFSAFYNKSTNQASGLTLKDSISNGNVFRKAQWQNIPNYFIEQYGAQISINISLLNNRILLKPYMMYQTNTYHNTALSYFVSGAPLLVPKVQPAPYNVDNATATFKNVMDPKITGGFSLDYTIAPKWRLYISGYAYSQYYMYTNLDRPTTAQIAVGNTINTSINNADVNNIPTKMVFSTKLDYKIAKRLSVFINARNITNNTSREMQASDKIGGFYLVGLNYHY